jgi:hypothetical protein
VPEGPEYADNLYYVWGFNGLLVIDACSHTEAQGSYGAYFGCDVTMIEHCMLVPEPEAWGTKWQEPDIGPHVCGYDDPECDDNCEICNPIPNYFPTTQVDPSDPRVASIDLEADKAAVEARVDQMLAYQRDRDGQGAGSASPPQADANPTS